MFISFRERGNRESTHYQLPPELTFAEAKDFGKKVIRSKLDKIDPLLFSRAVATLQTASGLIVAKIYLSSDRRLVWEDTSPDKLSGDQKKEMCKLLGYRSVNEYLRETEKSRGVYYDKMGS